MNTGPQRSTFVTVIGWIFVIFSGFATLISIVQNIMVQLVFNTPEVERAMQAPAPGTPAFAVFMISHIELFFALFMVVSAATLASSIGLLRRWNWARVVFVALMVLGVVWNLGGLALQVTLLSSMQDGLATAAAPGGPDMRVFSIAIIGVSSVMALALSGLFAWIARRLLSPAIAAEFRA